MNDQTQIGKVPTSRHRGKGCLRWLVAGIAVFLGLMLVGYIYEPLAEAADAKAYPPPGQLIDVGGYRLHINCTGTASPTVLIEAGGYSPIEAGLSLLPLSILLGLRAVEDAALGAKCFDFHPDGTATAGDYQGGSGTLTFGPGETRLTVPVSVTGDRAGETDETFVVRLTGVTNAAIGDGQGVCTIRDDEPRVGINDVSKAEGRKPQTTLFTFTVTLSAPYAEPVSMSGLQPCLAGLSPASSS